MCFSAEASFVASVALGAAGVVALKKAACRAEVMFAGIPLVFAAQQFTEGCVWLALSNPLYAAWENSVVHAFLIVAEVVWPLWAPLALFLLEKDPAHKRVFHVLIGTGVLVSLVFAYVLAFIPAHAQIGAHHIRYLQDFSLAGVWFSGIFYFIPTVMPFFVSTIRSTRGLGLLLLGSYLITHVWFKEYLTSVWCFFAAIMSVVVLLILKEMHGQAAPEDARLKHT